MEHFPSLPPQEAVEHTAEQVTYVMLGDIASKLSMQTQYLSYYLTGIGGKPNLGKGLRFTVGSGGNYHAIKVHPDDVSEFIARVSAARGLAS